MQTFTDNFETLTFSKLESKDVEKVREHLKNKQWWKVIEKDYGIHIFEVNPNYFLDLFYIYRSGERFILEDVNRMNIKYKSSSFEEVLSYITK